MTPSVAGATARVRARAFARRLDRALATGADPAGDPALAVRAAALTGQRRRDELATALELLIRRAPEPPSPSRVAPARDAVAANASTIRALAVALRAPAPVYAGGVARLVLLLRDGTGPVYCDRRDDALTHALAGVAGALRGAEPAYSTSVCPWRRSQSLWAR